MSWFLGKSLSNFVPPASKLYNPYCHTECLAYEDETCEEEIQRNIKSFVKGKDWKVLFKKYANYNSGYIENDEMGDFLIDIGVSEWCQWPTLVLAELDPNNDGKLSLE